MKKLIRLLSFVLIISYNISQSNSNFWDIQRKGANTLDVKINEETIIDAKKYNIQYLRISVDKFPTKKRDFLIGNCDNYTGLVEEDLMYLKNILNNMKKHNMPVVLTMLSLPGVRWAQNNKDKNDFRIYLDGKYVEQAAKFWHDLALELKDYDNIVAYNILNEPRYETLHDIEECSKKHQDKLLTIYEKIISKIREVDKDKTIILDLSNNGDPECFEYLEPVKDKNIIYAFHMYEPMAYTHSYARWMKNKSIQTYPDINKNWNKKYIKSYLSVVSEWQNKYNIPATKIAATEFGANRLNKGVDLYFNDLIEIFNENKWHWAFYAFQEEWQLMDYQLGNKKLTWNYWKEHEKCEKIKFKTENCQNFNRKYYIKNKIFDTLLHHLKN